MRTAHSGRPSLSAGCLSVFAAQNEANTRSLVYANNRLLDNLSDSNGFFQMSIGFVSVLLRRCGFSCRLAANVNFSNRKSANRRSQKSLQIGGFRCSRCWLTVCQGVAGGVSGSPAFLLRLPRLTMMRALRYSV